MPITKLDIKRINDCLEIEEALSKDRPARLTHRRYDAVLEELTVEAGQPISMLTKAQLRLAVTLVENRYAQKGRLSRDDVAAIMMDAYQSQLP